MNTTTGSTKLERERTRTIDEMVFAQEAPTRRTRTLTELEELEAGRREKDASTAS